MTKSVLNVDYYQILEDAYKEHGNVIVAFDFDNTVFDYHNKGLDFSQVIELLKECENLEFPLICLTSNTGKRVDFIDHYIKEVLGINSTAYKGVNVQAVKEEERTDFFIPYAGCSSDKYTKPYFNILLDDKAGLGDAYRTLRKLVNNIKINNI